MAEPKISIVIPSYNQGEFIEETLLSVIGQNYPNIEIIVIDGGSTDITVEIIRKYESHLAYWVSEKDNGQAHAINKGFVKAGGDIYGWINSDDFYLPGYLKKVGKTFASQSEIDIVYGNSVTLDERDGKTYEEFGNLILEDFLVFGSIVQSHVTFWRADIHQPLDENISCALDYELWLRLFPDRKWKHLNYFGGVFRLQEDSKSMGMKNNFQQKWEADKKYIEKKFNIKKDLMALHQKFRYLNYLYKYYCNLKTAGRRKPDLKWMHKSAF